MVIYELSKSDMDHIRSDMDYIRSYMTIYVHILKINEKNMILNVEQRF